METGEDIVALVVDELEDSAVIDDDAEELTRANAAEAREDNSDGEENIRGGGR